MQEDITVSAKGALIEKARARAQAWGTTLEDELSAGWRAMLARKPRLRRGWRSSWRRWRSSGI